MAEIFTLVVSEPVRVDPEGTRSLYMQLGQRNADDIICRAIEELAVRLTHCERLCQENNWPELRKSARSLIAIADQIGMATLACAAENVSQAADCRDRTAICATLARLIRIGERSLTEVWDIQHLSI